MLEGYGPCGGLLMSHSTLLSTPSQVEATNNNLSNKGSKNAVLFIYLFCFLGLHPWYMEVPSLGVESEL